MLKKLCLSVLAIFVLQNIAFSQASIKVTVVDGKTKEAVPFATVVVFTNGIQSGVQNTDFDGVAVIKPLNAGKYDVKVNFIGYQTKQLSGVLVGEGKSVNLDISISNDEGIKLDEVKVEAYIVPLVDPDTKSGGTVTREQYQNMATKNISSVASTTAGVFQADEGSALNVRGSRSDGSTQTFIDGERVIGGAAVPQASVEQIAVILGGLPAQYGDATGGVISITTRGPQSKLFGGIELITSGLGESKTGKTQGLDAYGYNFIGFSVGGPIISKIDTATGAKKAVLGYILSGQYTHDNDQDPSAIGIWKVNDEKIKYLQENPLRPSVTGTGVNRNAEFLTLSDLVKVKARQNVASNSVVLNGKIDFKPTSNVNFTLGASMDYANNNQFRYSYSLMNYSNNQQYISNTIRTYGRMTWKFGNNESNKDIKEASTIKNAFFSMQVGYTSQKETYQDATHKNRLFDYGYIGDFQQSKAPSYSYTTRTIKDPISGSYVPISGFFQDGFSNTAYSYNRTNTKNPLEANYTDFVYGFLDNRVTNQFEVQQNLGLINGDLPIDIYGLYASTGRPYEAYSVSNNTQLRFTSSLSADVKNHALQLGLEFDQRSASNYYIAPVGLWGRMRQLVNNHTSQLDTTNAIYNQNLSGSIPYYDYERKYDQSQQKELSIKLLDVLGLPTNYTGWVDVDHISPDKLSMNMLSGEDFLNGGASPLGQFYGYDHTGKKSTTRSSFNDYFNQKDIYGFRTYAQNAFTPIYMATYIQDKFDFKDIKFNIGLRVDRYDANQKVLKDPYLFKEAYTAGSTQAQALGSVPSNISSDAVVYVDDLNASKIVGYRDGSTWYSAAGAEIADPIVLAQSTTTGTIQPYLVNSTQTGLSMEQSAFKDFKPQINVMPRVAFSFPISDVANFFAHYDLLVQRPSGTNRLDLTDYEFIFNNTGSVINNADLKPTKTTDYELGFTQILNEKKNSALKITSYYRELRDQVAIVRLSQAYPKTYLTYKNQDFGTVKGFSFEYDLRRTGGIQLTANYTLQFADGSGSNANGGYNLANSGQPNLRVTLPLDFDQRHTFTTTFDYRFGTGADYRGPVLKLKGKVLQILKNVGGNMVWRAGSGTPFSRQTTASANALTTAPGQTSMLGQLNGSYKPWSFRADIRIDKNIELVWGNKKEGEKGKQANLNIYLQVLNIFNRKNIINVYRYTGNANDDGFINSPLAQATINSNISPAAYTTLYSLKVNNPSNYSRPRVIRLGVQLNF